MRFLEGVQGCYVCIYSLGTYVSIVETCGNRRAIYLISKVCEAFV